MEAGASPLVTPSPGTFTGRGYAKAQVSGGQPATWLPMNELLVTRTFGLRDARRGYLPQRGGR